MRREGPPRAPQGSTGALAVTRRDWGPSGDLSAGSTPSDLRFDTISLLG